MARKKDSGKVMVMSKSVVIRMPEDLVNHLKKVCISMSHQKGVVISLSEFIRETMMQYCPLERQQDLFEKETRKKKK